MRVRQHHKLSVHERRTIIPLEAAYFVEQSSRSFLNIYQNKKQEPLSADRVTMSLKLRPYDSSMSPDLTISQSTLDSEPSPSSVDRYSAALDALNASNHNLEYKLAKIQSRNLRLKLDLMRLQRHITSFHHDLLATWEADILTSLIEVVYRRQGRKLHRGHDIDLRRLDRKALSAMYTIAAGRIGRRALRSLFGLSQHYWLALQKYDEVAHLRSTSPSRTEGTFARWLMTERETNPKRAGFWARLFPICYGRTVEESSKMV
ncbi:hypothetical protein CNMCM6936_001422 [Aspergillus lentulus]|nr:hypothetical protein CNMCM6936_001422 [Aspergillus lentulus]